MRLRRIAISAAFAVGLTVLPLATAKAQNYPPQNYPPPLCSPFPLSWPFCVVGAVVGAAVTLVTAPFWLLSGAPPPFYYGYYYPPPPYYAPGYYPPGYYAPGNNAPPSSSGPH
jgi:hypothetical protein